MKIQIAESAGFCFGVNRAVNLVLEQVALGKKVYTLGEIIHNPQMVETLKAKGVKIVTDPSQVPSDGTLVIRSHGVGLTVY
ncbi:MAG: bifunctional 4-hydroxy-3-methylbut-2-enyl diphosphate reductase/30S ribosomal protein S1, partial [Oscillospiraceae bacterium]